LYIQQNIFKKLQKDRKKWCTIGAPTTIPLWLYGDTHMSLEQALERNTEMMADLIRALEGFQPVAAAPQEAPPIPKLRPKAEAPEPSAKPEVPTTTITATAPTTLGAPTPTETTKAIDYAQEAAAITSTFKVDKAKVIAALAKFGAAKGPQLKVEDYAAFLEELAS
jgi:hypothetical protein